MSENANRLFDLVRPIQWDAFKKSSQQYVNRNGYRYDHCTTLKPHIKLKELRQMAKKRGIKKYYLMKRADLVETLGVQ